MTSLDSLARSSSGKCLDSLCSASSVCLFLSPDGGGCVFEALTERSAVGLTFQRSRKKHKGDEPLGDTCGVQAQ